MRRRFMMVPNKKVKYLGFTGTQEIDLGFVPDQSVDAFEIKFRASTLVDRARIISANSGGRSMHLYELKWQNNWLLNALLGYKNNAEVWGGTGIPLNNDVHVVKIDYYENKSYCDGVLKNNPLVPADTTIIGRAVGNLKISASADSNYGRFQGEIYWLKYYRSGNLIHEYIPKVYNGEGVLYDKIGKTYHGNTGSGAPLIIGY